MRKRNIFILAVILIIVLGTIGYNIANINGDNAYRAKKNPEKNIAEEKSNYYFNIDKNIFMGI